MILIIKKDQNNHSIQVYLRFRNVRARVTRMLKRIVNPRMPPTPIQYQFGSVKLSKISRTANPSLVELSEDYKESKRALLS